MSKIRGPLLLAMVIYSERRVEGSFGLGEVGSSEVRLDFLENLMTPRVLLELDSLSN